MDVQSMTTETLNEILESAHTALAKYNTFLNGRTYAECKNDPLFKALSDSNKVEWENLLKAIQRAVPTRLIGVDNKEKNIGTVGITTTGNVLLYSEKADSKHTMSSYRLDRIKSFLPFIPELESEN